jgi:hypothetical protein
VQLACEALAFLFLHLQKDGWVEGGRLGIHELARAGGALSASGKKYSISVEWVQQALGPKTASLNLEKL